MNRRKTAVNLYKGFSSWNNYFINLVVCIRVRRSCGITRRVFGAIYIRVSTCVRAHLGMAQFFLNRGKIEPTSNVFLSRRSAYTWETEGKPFYLFPFQIEEPSRRSSFFRCHVCRGNLAREGTCSWKIIFDSVRTARRVLVPKAQLSNDEILHWKWYTENNSVPHCSRGGNSQVYVKLRLCIRQ